VQKRKYKKFGCHHLIFRFLILNQQVDCLCISEVSSINRKMSKNRKLTYDLLDVLTKPQLIFAFKTMGRANIPLGIDKMTLKLLRYHAHRLFPLMNSDKVFARKEADVQASKPQTAKIPDVAMDSLDHFNWNTIPWLETDEDYARGILLM